MFQFSFISTHDDLITAYDAERNAQTGLSSWSRGAVLLLGAMWLFGFIFLGSSASRENIYLPLVWLSLGVLIVWKVGFKPYLEKNKSKNQMSQSRKSQFRLAIQVFSLPRWVAGN